MGGPSPRPGKRFHHHRCFLVVLRLVAALASSASSAASFLAPASSHSHSRAMASRVGPTGRSLLFAPGRLVAARARRRDGPRPSTFPSAAAASASGPSPRGRANGRRDDAVADDDVERRLASKLRRLASLNGGRSVNPRSPRQVSDLLYGHFRGGEGTSERGGSFRGPTDRATLRRIVSNDGAPSDGEGGDEAAGKRREAASLVLQCRELLNGGGRAKAAPPSSGSFASKANWGLAKEGSTSNNKVARQPLSLGSVQPLAKRQQAGMRHLVADFSNVASSQFSDEGKNDAGVEEEAIAPLLEDRDEKTITRSDAVPHSTTNMSPYERMVMDLFPNIDNTVGSYHGDDEAADIERDEDRSDAAGECIDPYWLEPLLSLTKPSARSLARQLQPAGCPMGYDPAASPAPSLLSNNAAVAPQKRATSLLSYVRRQKSILRDAVVLTRVGDFYESYGVDAALLVEHCGLNPMAGKARAGCPWRNVQATLDGLTSRGLRVAVYEEWNGRGEAPAGVDVGGGKKLKARYLAQVVSSANPTYMHGLVLNDDSGSAAESSPGRSYVGVLEARAGYTVVEVSAEERTAVVSERLTAEAVRCRLAAYPPADPLFYVPPYGDEETSAGGVRRRRSDRLPFLPWKQRSSSSVLATMGRHHGYSRGGDAMERKVRVKTLPPALVVGPQRGLTDVERAKQTIVEAFLRLEDDSSMPMAGSSTEEGSGKSTEQSRSAAVTHEDFVIVARSAASSDQRNDAATKTHPLHLETATQLGLLSDPAIPPLISSLLPDAAPSASRRFLRRWLLVPPPPDVADAMSRLVGTLKDDDGGALPVSSANAPPMTGKVLGLIRAGQASAAVYREVLMALDAAGEVLLLDGGASKSADQGAAAGVVGPLMTILRHDTGIAEEAPNNDSASLRQSFLDAMEIIGNVVSTRNIEQHTLQNIDSDDSSEELDFVSFHGDVVPPAFFERNEAMWRGRVWPDALECAQRVPLAAAKLTEAVAVNFWGVERVDRDDDGVIDLSHAREAKNPVVQDIFNNLIAIRSIPSWAKESKEANAVGSHQDSDSEEHIVKSVRYFHPLDRNGKVLRNRYTTDRVQEAMSEYVEACADARTEVEAVLSRLAWKIVDDGHLPAIQQASHLNLILSTAAHHAASSNTRGWNTGTIYNGDSNDGYDLTSAGHFDGVWPYWMDQSVSNAFDLDGLFLLTAPNMSGKSTLMRSTAAAALLINSGLCAPTGQGSALRRFDSLFVRGASADVPTEDKSAFGAEMGDVSALLRSCGRRSLVFVDEIGRGTSPRDGTSLAGAILERMAEGGMSGMFATHLHGVLELPFSPAAEGRLRKKRMAIQEDENGQLKWTYTLEDGVCTNSLALLTAAKFGLPESILKRAEELSECWDAGIMANDCRDNEPAGLNQSIDSSGTDHSIQHAITILEETVGTDLSVSVQIPPSYMSPPSLEGSSCVYILQMGMEGGNKPRYYVGETDSLSQRLAKHRSKGDDWSLANAVAIRVESKSRARNVESLVIQRMAQRGFHMVSVTDGLSVRRFPGKTE